MSLLKISIALAFFAVYVDAQPSNKTVVTTATLSARQDTSTQNQDGILKYNPSMGNYAVGVLFAVYTAVISFYIWRRRDKWALALPIGTLCSAIGYLIRPTMTRSDTSITLYALQQFLVVISPCAFLAFNYLLYGRMILAVDANFGKENMDAESMQSGTMTATQKLTMIHKAGGPKREKSTFSMLPPRIVGRVFIWSDVVTFLVQCCAGGMQAAGGSENPDLTEIGDKLFLVGVILQGISYILFTVLITYATYKILFQDSPSVRNERRRVFGLHVPVFLILAGLYISSLFIIVRSIYRIIEFAQGYTGYLITHEVYLFALDSAPLLVAVGVWVVMWPTDLLARILSERYENTEYSLTSNEYSSFRESSSKSPDDTR